jgi:cytoskeletal protein CcmA (bactofilin family)
MGFFKRSDVKVGDEGGKKSAKDRALEQDAAQNVGIVSGVLSSPRDSEEETLFGNVVERRFGPGAAAASESSPPPLEIDDETDSGARASGAFESPTLEVDAMGLIGRSTRITGQIEADEDLEIQGRVEGRIHLATHQVTVGRDGVVQADVEAHTVIVIGRVTGNVLAEEVVEVKSGGFIGGDVTAPRVIMADGAIVVGGLDMSAAISDADTDTGAKTDSLPDARVAGPAKQPERPTLKSVEGREAESADLHSA